MPFFYDPTFILLVPAFALAAWAQYRVRSAFARYSQVRASSGYTGAQLAQELLRRAGVRAQAERIRGERAARVLGAVTVEMTPGELSDHYDPRANVLRLSEPVYGSDSIAALGVAAHETGHAIQQAVRYPGMAVRAALLPAAQFGSNLAFPLAFIGLLFTHSQLLVDIGILLSLGAVAFTLVTLPVELNASGRALVLLREGGFVTQQELQGVRKVLGAAALTYLAAVAVSIINLIRLFMWRERE